jgi:1-acyl-sn-glycerol-3-phosphate acyltransferase
MGSTNGHQNGTDSQGVSVAPSPSAHSRYSGLVCRALRWMWLGRVDSQAPALPPGSLVLAAHYNGAIDGYTYGSQMPPFLAVISAQWHRNIVGRLLLPGIAVQRAKDGVTGTGNLAGFRSILEHLRGGDRILFFPEGTSQLGTERLPVQQGTLLLLRQARRADSPPPVYFAAAHYHNPPAWRSRVTIGWVGPVPLPPSAEADSGWVMAGLLEAQARAYAQPAPPRSFLARLGPLAALPFLPTWWATAKLASRAADGDNVVALWRVIFGVPLTALTGVVLTGACVLLGWPSYLPLASLVLASLLWSL